MMPRWLLKTSSATLPWQGHETGDPRRLPADCSARLRINHLHLHRLCADVFPDWRGTLSVRSVGRSRGLRHVGVLFPFANPGTNHGALHHARTRAQNRSTEDDPRTISAWI